MGITSTDEGRDESDVEYFEDHDGRAVADQEPSRAQGRTSDFASSVSNFFNLHAPAGGAGVGTSSRGTNSNVTSGLGTPPDTRPKR
jgi:hypothetical protein